MKRGLRHHDLQKLLDDEAVNTSATRTGCHTRGPVASPRRLSGWPGWPGLFYPDWGVPALICHLPGAVSLRFQTKEFLNFKRPSTCLPGSGEMQARNLVPQRPDINIQHSFPDFRWHCAPRAWAVVASRNGAAAGFHGKAGRGDDSVHWKH